MTLWWWRRRRARQARPTTCPGVRGQAGSVAVEWAMGLAVLVVPVALLVGVMPAWAERQSMARLAAREAARAAALASDATAGEAAGRALVAQIAANHGVPAADLVTVAVTVPRDAAGQPLRGGQVSATVAVRVPVTDLPLFGAVGGFTSTATHHEAIDLYRSLPAPPRAPP